MNIVFFGTSAFGLAALEGVAGSRHHLAAVVTTPNKPSGRDLKVQASPVKQWAADHGVRCLDFFKEHPSQALLALKELNADVFVVISFGVILGKEALRLPRVMPLNVHASLLPKYRGASPMQAAILNEERQTGITVMRMVERLDAGDILLKKRTPLDPDETIETLEKRLGVLAAEAALEALDLLEKGRPALTPQDEREAVYTKKIAKSDGKIHWKESAKKIHAKTRAYLGWPGTYFFFGGKRIVLSKARPGFSSRAAAPGTVLEVSDPNRILVAAGKKTALKLERLQLEGKKPLEWKEFVRGFPLKAGDILE